jgi:signal transduction histidine kinase
VAVDVHGLVSEVVAQLAPQAGRRAVQINLGPPAAARHALADPRRLRQVLTRVLGNAIRFNRDRGRVDVRLTLLEKSDVAISVSDTGCGMSPGAIAQAFEPCALPPAGCALHQGGTPCLAAARAAARDMNGDVVVASAPGVGSTFVVSLPAAAVIDGHRTAR